MKVNNNIGIYLSNTADKQRVIREILNNKLLSDFLDLSKLKGGLFSSSTIEKMVDEELRHDRFVIRTAENANLQTMSSGQQKKALLQYQLLQQPDYIILDDVYANVDKATQLEITDTLTSISKNIVLIQICFRKRDLLPTIDLVYTLTDSFQLERVDNLQAWKSDSNTKSAKIQMLPNSYSDIHADLSDTLIELKNVNVQYGDKPILENINWKIQKAEFWQLVGPNGSGKSTLISMICGDNPKAYGQDLTLFGMKKGSGETIWDIKKQIGYFTPAMIHQFKKADSVENMIISGLMDSVGLYVQPTDLQKDLAQSWLKMLGKSFYNKSFHQLSIGQQRMVMVVRALIKHPPLLILDEPTIELDEANSQLFIDLINKIVAEKKIAIIYVSHRDESELLPEKIFELKKSTQGYTGVMIK